MSNKVLRQIRQKKPPQRRFIQPKLRGGFSNNYTSTSPLSARTLYQPGLMPLYTLRRPKRNINPHNALLTPQPTGPSQLNHPPAITADFSSLADGTFVCETTCLPDHPTGYDPSTTAMLSNGHANHRNPTSGNPQQVTTHPQAHQGQRENNPIPTAPNCLSNCLTHSIRLFTKLSRGILKYFFTVGKMRFL